MKIKRRAVSVSELLAARYKVMDFDDEFFESFGAPEMTGSWLIWGPPKNGKTRFVLQLCKYMTRFGRVAYNSLEEGASQSMKSAFIECGMEEVKNRIILLNNEPVSEMKERLRRHKSPDIVVIDSLQYTGMSYADYKSLKDEFRNKLFLIISHADGKEPASRVARSVRFDAFVAIRVEGFRAFPFSRYGGGKQFEIWPYGAQQYWGN